MKTIWSNLIKGGKPWIYNENNLTYNQIEKEGKKVLYDYIRNIDTYTNQEKS